MTAGLWDRLEQWRAQLRAEDQSWREPRALRWLGLVLFWAVFLAGAWLRWRIRVPAVSSDEIALVKPLAVWGIRFFDNIEWARNSPLFPFVFGLIPDRSAALQWGRDTATICGLAAVVPAFFAARRATGGDTISGAMAAALVALNPVLAYESVTFRPYGVWALVETWRLACLCALLTETSETARPRTWQAFVALTCLLPWTHYVSFAILIFEAIFLYSLLPARRHLLKAHAIAALTALPLIGFILYMRNSPESVGAAGSRAIEIAFARHFGNDWRLAALLFALAIVFSWRPAQRAILAHWLSVGAAGLLLSAVTLVRPAVSVVGVPSFALAIPTVARVLLGRARYLGLAAAAYLVLVPSPFAPIPGRDYGSARESPDIAAFAADLRRETAPGSWSVFPDWNLTVLTFVLTTRGAHVRQPEPNSIQIGPTRLVPFRDRSQPPPGRVVVFSCDDVLEGCTPTGGRPCAKTYQCP